MGSHEKAGQPGYRELGFYNRETEISAARMKIFPYEYSSLGNQDETFVTKKLCSRNIAATMA